MKQKALLIVEFNETVSSDQLKTFNDAINKKKLSPAAKKKKLQALKAKTHKDLPVYKKIAAAYKAVS